MTVSEAPIALSTVLARVAAIVRADDPLADGAPHPPPDLELHLGEDEPPLGLEERFDLVCARLGLEELDRAVLAVCAAPELDDAFGRAFGALQGDALRRHPAARLVARVLAGPTLSAGDVLLRLDARAPLVASGAVRVGGDGPRADRPLVLGPQAVAYLLGMDLGGLVPYAPLRRVDATDLPLGRDEAVARLGSLLAYPGELPIAVTGSDAGLVLCEAAEQGLAVLDAGSAAGEEACADLALAAALEDRLPVIDGLAELPAAGRDRAIARLCALPCRPVLCLDDREDAVALADLAVVLVDVPPPTAAEREAAWRQAGGVDDVREVADRFRLDVGRIAEASAVARAEATVGASGPLDAGVLGRGARLASSRRVGELAELLAPGPGWEDIVLGPRQLDALRSVAAFLRRREHVLDDWDFRRVAGDRGMVVLFSGESGTGKTLSARVVAGAAGLDVYRVDLSGLFSKWLGETEKNLDRIFRAARGSNAVLFFDEADVVFGRRGEASGANDRYANLQTSYLLQRIEAYDGVTVLATNLRSNVDEAFLRRIDLAVDFPPPDAATRRLLWAALLPDRAPLAADVDLDFLAERFELSGGGIRNCTVAAAYAAAEAGTPIGMDHLVRAVALEFGKLGRLTLEADFERFHASVRG